MLVEKVENVEKVADATNKSKIDLCYISLAISLAIYQPQTHCISPVDVRGVAAIMKARTHPKMKRRCSPSPKNACVRMLSAMAS